MSCNQLQSGEAVDNRDNIALKLCIPIGSTNDCSHCTHAGGFTSCWKLNSRCGGEARTTKYSMENWGYDQEGNWLKNFDLKGNRISLDSICYDRYRGICYEETSYSLASKNYVPFLFIFFLITNYLKI